MMINERMNGYTFGNRLRYLRCKNRYTIPYAAERIGVSAASLASYEKDRTSPTCDILLCFCDFYNVSADWLLRGE